MWISTNFVLSLQTNPCVIATLDQKRHGLQTGDTITLQDIKGMNELNNTKHKITYISGDSFSIDIDTTSHSKYHHGGILKKIKQPTTVTFTPLAKQLQSPDVVINDLSKLDAPLMSLVALSTLNKDKKSLNSDENQFLKDCVETNSKLTSPVETLDVGYLTKLIKTSKGVLAPLCAAVGGIAAQEVIKGISGKFTPLKQWLFIDAVEVCGKDFNVLETNTYNPRYTQLMQCISVELWVKLMNCRLFMVGCGAIGCEMMKNFALLGVSSGDGSITITDNDLIEKSNLNRQFLFRPWHIQVKFCPKIFDFHFLDLNAISKFLQNCTDLIKIAFLETEINNCT